MFDSTSRYAALAVMQMTLPNGREVSYVTRRILPQSATLTVLSQTKLAAGERLDLFTARTLGDPLTFWRICDANAAMDPDDLITPGAILTVPLPTN